MDEGSCAHNQRGEIKLKAVHDRIYAYLFFIRIHLYIYNVATHIGGCLGHMGEGECSSFQQSNGRE